MIESRPYTGDVAPLQAAVASWIAQAGYTNYLHVGDIPHRLYNGVRNRFPLEDIVRYWELDGQMLAFSLVYPHRNEYEAYLHPDYRGGDLERDVLRWSEDKSYEWIEKLGSNDKLLKTDVSNTDTVRIALLEEVGYEQKEPWIATTLRSLVDPIPEPRLPDGYHIRSARMGEAAKLVEAHIGAFTHSNWTVEQYEYVMTSSGYDPEREIVVVAPDGSFAAFCVYWLDTVNKRGLFEPVGTHYDYQRKGLARAMMQHTMHLMVEQGMEAAMVEHSLSKEASTNLYAGLGFEQICTWITFER